MPEIDHTFISNLEGGQKLAGYVPAADVSKSGVTVATGFDLGARNEADLTRLSLAPALKTKLKPYLGKKGVLAQKALKENPLSITKIEADQIDAAVKKSGVSDLKSRYNTALKAGSTKFEMLPQEMQTVIASVAFQYGGNLPAATPTFWKLVTAQDWSGVVKELKNFKDKYPTRRNKEAVLLEKGVTRQAALQKTTP